VVEQSDPTGTNDIYSRLHDLMRDGDASLAGGQRQALRLVQAHLGVDHGRIQRHDPGGETDTVLVSVGGDAPWPPAGATLEREGTRGRQTADGGVTIAPVDPPTDDRVDDHTCRERDSECCIEAEIVVGGECCGTVRFASREPREGAFDGAEKAAVELLARLLGEGMEAAPAGGDLVARCEDHGETGTGRKIRNAARKKYGTLLDLVPDAVFLIEARNQEFVEVNAGAAELTGYDASDLVEMDVSELHPEEDRDRYLRLFEGQIEAVGRDRFADGTPLEIERADGSRVPVGMNVGTVRVGGRQFVQVVARDISDRRRRRRELDRSREYLQQTEEAADIGGWEVDFRSDSLKWTEEVYHIHGVALDYDPSVSDGLAFYHPEDRPAIAEALDRLRAEGEPMDMELRIETADDAVRWVHVVGRPEYEADEVVAARGVFRDVTERKERERDLRLRSRAIEESPVGITIADATEPDTPIVYANEGFERLTGYATERVLGRNCRFLQGEGTDADTRADIGAAIDAEQSVQTEIRNYRADGTPFWNSLTVSPVANEDGDRVTHFVGIQEDITATKRRQHLIEVLDRVLRHNLRNDMTAVMGFARVIADRGDGDVASMARRIFETAEGLTELTEKTRDFESAVTDPGPVERRDVCGDVREVVSELRREYPDVTFRVDTCQCEEVMATDRIDLALRELGTNAAEHGSPPVEFDVTTDAGEVVVSVHDSGPGLPECEQGVLESGRETPLEHGSGLGLWMVNWLITVAGGELTVTVDDGTTITARFELPARRTDEPRRDATSGSQTG
jgi:PAS domain S-box-containing protein